MKHPVVPPTDAEGPPSRIDVYATWIDDEAQTAAPARRMRADEPSTDVRRPTPAAARRR